MSFVYFVEFLRQTCYTRNMLNFDLQLIKKLLTHLGYLAKASVQLYDENFEGTYACTEPCNKFCQMVKCHYADRCRNSDSCAMQKVKQADGNSMHYTCHFGMKETVIKLQRGKIIYGYIVIGPMRDTRTEKQSLATIGKYCPEYGLNEKEMRNFYFKTTRFSEQKFEAVKELTLAIFEYAVNKNLITVKHNVFENTIAPYVKANLDKPLGSDELCEVFCMSEKQIYTAVVKATGMPPKKYVTAQRMLGARELIETTDEPLTDIADKVGVHDYNYFGKVFRKTFGHAPSYYRRKHK